ncbi:MAG: hypothetical protein KDB60_00075 [Propionibacteriaceae bacterium]|nr:hypothetical protein [Propionibacteriaceae bacterium]
MIPNPFDIIGSQAGRIVTDGWIAMWLSVWNGGQWLLRLILGWMDAWLTPDLSASGPARTIYPATFWLAGAVLLVMAVVQIGIAAGRRDGRSLARLLIGVAQFAIIWGGWIGYSVAIVTAAGGLTHAAMESLMGVTSWKAWQPWKPFDPAEIADAGVATVLGLMGLLLWIAAIGHLLVILTRDAALMVIVATTPIAAAGLANETTRAWFWKAFRWFHAAAFTPLLVVLVTGVGMKMAEGVATDGATSVQGSIGTAVPAIVLICIAVVCPVALFKMLAFVDPGTSSGAAMRAGLTASGGIGGLLAGKPMGSGNDSASTASSQGRSAGEDSAEAATTTRASSAIQGAMAVLGPAGKVMAAGLGALTTVGAYATTVTSDLANQEGVGNNSYYPDYTDRSRRDATRANREQQGRSGDQSDNTEPDNPPSPPPPAPTSGGPAPAPASGLSASGGSGGAAAAGSSDASVAAAAI